MSIQRWCATRYFSDILFAIIIPLRSSFAIAIFIESREENR